MKAQYLLTCSDCRQPIRPGDEVTRNGMDWRHAHCPTTREDHVRRTSEHAAYSLQADYRPPAAAHPDYTGCLCASCHDDRSEHALSSDKCPCRYPVDWCRTHPCGLTREGAR